MEEPTGALFSQPAFSPVFRALLFLSFNLTLLFFLAGSHWQIDTLAEMWSFCHSLCIDFFFIMKLLPPHHPLAVYSFVNLIEPRFPLLNHPIAHQSQNPLSTYGKNLSIFHEYTNFLRCFVFLHLCCLRFEWKLILNEMHVNSGSFRMPAALLFLCHSKQLRIKKNGMWQVCGEIRSNVSGTVRHSGTNNKRDPC